MQLIKMNKLTLLLAVLLSVTAVKAQSEKTVFNPEQYGVTSLAIAPDARAGAKLFTGVYFYRCQMSAGESKKVSKTQKIIILNNK